MLYFMLSQDENNIKYSLNSKTLEIQKLKNQYGANYTINDVIINFRFCKPGEIILNNYCFQCSEGSYSFTWNSTQCENCIDNSFCLGQEKISVDSGYWRNTANSTKIIACPNRLACLGGYNSTNLHPVNCERGYGGLLCSECETDSDGVKYEKLSSFQCSKCPDPVVNAIRVIGLIITMLVFIGILITVNIRKNRESQVSILMRIMTNYLQIMTVTLSYGMKFPDLLLNLFIPVQKLGASSQTILSFDCFAKSASLDVFTPSTAFMKICMLALLPIILIILFIFVFGFFHIILPKWFTDFKRNMVISTITILFLMHPTIAETSLGMFQCINIDEGINKVKIDLNIDCYSLQHITWCLIIGVPMIIVWVLGCPIIALVILIRNRKNLEKQNIQRYFIVLYQGLKNHAFYWEFINTFRKLGIVTINVFLSTFSQTYKGLSAIILMVTFLRIQIVLAPYKLDVNNHCEYISYASSCLTLFAGVLFVSDVKRVGLIDVLVFILVVVFNIYFILFWSYLMLFNFHKFSFARKLTSYLRMILMRKNENNKLSSRSTEKKSAFVLSSQNVSNFQKPKQKTKRVKILKKKKEEKKLFIDTPSGRAKESSSRAKKGTPKVPLDPLSRNEKIKFKRNNKKNNKKILNMLGKVNYEKEIIDEELNENKNSFDKDDFYIYKMKIEQLKEEQTPDSKSKILPINEEDDFFEGIHSSIAQRSALKRVFNPK